MEARLQAPWLAAFVLLAACDAPTEAPVGEPAGMVASSHLTFDCSAQSSIPEIECEALVALYNSTDGDNWIDNTGWLSASDPCSWFGVSCFSGSVTGLLLVANQLSGPIPPELGNLGSANSLFLDENQLSGSIPAELGNLGSLVNLWLFDNQLSGSIPAELGNLGFLVVLALQGNELSGSIPAQLGNLLILEFLGLGDNLLSGLVPIEVAQVGGALDEDCQFSGNLALFIPDTGPYQNADVDADGFICQLPLEDAETVASRLVDMVEQLEAAGVLNQGQANALSSKLDHVLDLLAEGKTHTALNVLGAFIDQVETLRADGVLSQSEADELIAVAEILMEMIETG